MVNERPKRSKLPIPPEMQNQRVNKSLGGAATSLKRPSLNLNLNFGRKSNAPTNTFDQPSGRSSQRFSESDAASPDKISVKEAPTDR